MSSWILVGFISAERTGTPGLPFFKWLKKKSKEDYMKFEFQCCLVHFKMCTQSSHHGAAETNPTRNHEVLGLIPGLTQWVKDPELL